MKYMIYLGFVMLTMTMFCLGSFVEYKYGSQASQIESYRQEVKRTHDVSNRIAERYNDCLMGRNRYQYTPRNQTVVDE